MIGVFATQSETPPRAAAADFPSTFRKALLALNENRLDAAQSLLESAARMQPRNPRVWLALAQTYWKLHKPAQPALHNAETYGASDTVVLSALPTLYFEIAQEDLNRQDFAAALTTLDAAIKRFPDNVQLQLATGVAYYGLRRFSEAIDAFLRTISLDPSVEQPYVFLGRMLDQAEDRLPRFLSVFAAFEKNVPESYLAPFLTGKALALGNQPADAEAKLRRSIALNDAFWESHFELGALLSSQRKWEAAAAEMRRAGELNPKDAATHYHLARLYDRLGKPAEAQAERDLHARITAGMR
jgi:tetratricopeptide (TPR) repeat protein